jgi:hypothetical protein
MAGHGDQEARDRAHDAEFGVLADRMISIVRLIGAASGRSEIAGLSNARYASATRLAPSRPWSTPSRPKDSCAAN